MKHHIQRVRHVADAIEKQLEHVPERDGALALALVLARRYAVMAANGAEGATIEGYSDGMAQAIVAMHETRSKEGEQ